MRPIHAVSAEGHRNAALVVDGDDTAGAAGAGHFLEEHRAYRLVEGAAEPSTIYRDADDMRARLSEQVYRPVRWVETVRCMIDQGASSFVECGPGKVLTGLMRRIDRSLPAACVDSPDSLQKASQ